MSKTNGKLESETDLPEAHKRFADEYLIDLDATNAYLRAGNQVTQESAAVCGSRLLRDVKVQTYLNERRSELAYAIGITQERVIRHLANLAFYDVRKMFTDSGELKDMSDIDDDTAAAIMGVEVVENWEGRGKARKQTGFTKKVKCESKRAATVSLCEHLGWSAPKKVAFTDGNGRPLTVQLLVPEKYPLTYIPAEKQN